MARDNNGKFTHNTENKVIEIMNTKYKGFEYVSGYINADSHMKIKCKTCGHIFSYHADILRPSRNKTIRCKQCDKSDRDKTRELEASIKRTNKELKNIYKLLKKLLKSKQPKKEYIHICRQCGKEFSSNRKGMKYCTEQCAKRYHNSIKETKRRKHIGCNGYVDKDITLDKLIKRDNNTCYICGEHCDSNDYIRTKENYFIVGKNYPSLDHIRAVSKGGTHTWDNVKLAHCYCNSLKGNKKLSEFNI